MLDYVNKEREARGLKPLKMNKELTKLARMKSEDMVENNYFSHNSPTYGSPFEMLKDNNITYRSAAENIAGNNDVYRAHERLMASTGHRKNILDPDFDEIGIGIVEGSRYGMIFTQIFAEDANYFDSHEEDIDYEREIRKIEREKDEVKSEKDLVDMLEDLINDARDERDIKSLKLNKDLTKVAQLRAEEMVRRNKLYRDLPKYGTTKEMLEDRDIEFDDVKENVAKAFDVDLIHRYFMNKSQNKKNILEEDFKEMGLGIAKDKDNGLYTVVEIFVEPENEDRDREREREREENQDLTTQEKNEREMLRLINEEREKYGREPLKLNKDITKLARLKSEDMIRENYFAHTSPNYGGAADMLNNNNIYYRMVAENIAGNSTVERAHARLMNSPSHRSNILNPNLTEVGIGIVKGGRYGSMYTQIFIGK